MALERVRADIWKKSVPNGEAMVRTIAVLGSSLLFAVTVSAATMQVPHSGSEKYRDAGSHPAQGRSGVAAIQTRALLGKDGTTEVQVTTGGIEPAVAPVGTLTKVQIKLLSPSGDVLETDNYRKTLGDDGNAFFYYDRLPRGQLLQTTANVSGIDPARTDVVTAGTESVLRPDLKATALLSPSQARVNLPVTISGVVSELNGDVGAHATCGLFADGVQVASIPNVWIDAGSTVTCQFRATFSSGGTKQLEFRVTDVTPGDYDIGNNSVAGSITIVDNNFISFGAQAFEWQLDEASDQQRTITSTDGTVTGTFQRHDTQSFHFQWHGAGGTFNDVIPLDSGSITLQELGDGSIAGTSFINVTDLYYEFNDASGGCRSGFTVDGFVAKVCSIIGAGTIVQAYYNPGVLTYTETASANGDYGNWYYNAEGSSTNPGVYQDLGTVYTATLIFQSPAGVHESTATAVLDYHVDDQGTNSDCYTNVLSGGVETVCSTMYMRYRLDGGFSYFDHTQ